jgi:hypothetical protein
LNHIDTKYHLKTDELSRRKTMKFTGYCMGLKRVVEIKTRSW